MSNHFVKDLEQCLAHVKSYIRVYSLNENKISSFFVKPVKDIGL